MSENRPDDNRRRDRVALNAGVVLAAVVWGGVAFVLGWALYWPTGHRVSRASPTGRFVATVTPSVAGFTVTLRDTTTGKTQLVDRQAVWNPLSEHYEPRDVIWEAHGRGFLAGCDFWYSDGAQEDVYAYEVGPSGQTRAIGPHGAGWLAEIPHDLAEGVIDPKHEDDYKTVVASARSQLRQGRMLGAAGLGGPMLASLVGFLLYRRVGRLAWRRALGTALVANILGMAVGLVAGGSMALVLVKARPAGWLAFAGPPAATAFGTYLLIAWGLTGPSHTGRRLASVDVLAALASAVAAGAAFAADRILVASMFA